MPRKTRKEKIQADQRKSTFSSNFSLQDHNRADSPRQESTPSPYRFEYSKKTYTKTVESPLGTNTFAAIRSDLIKTIFLSGVLLALEFALYFSFR